MSKNGKRVFINEKQIRKEQVEAIEHNELHAHFFGTPNVPLREIRDRLDPVLRAHAIREITKDMKESDDAHG
jgi:hypothetical protein